jgi:hypothetical protein
VLALWLNRIFVVISPSHMTLVHTRGLPFNRKVVAEKSVKLQLPEDKSAHNACIIKTLSDMLNSLSVQGGQLTVTLSSYFARISLLPPLVQALKPEEQLKRTQLHFERIYGAIAKQWAFCSSRIKFQQPTLVSAIDQALLSGLQSMADGHRLRLASVEPSLNLILNHWKNHLHNTQAWFVVIEHTCCCIARFDHGVAISVTQFPCKNMLSSAEFQTLIQREALRHGETLHGKNLYLFSPKHPNLSLESGGAKLQHLCLPLAALGTQFSNIRLLKLLVEA